ncbi:MAG: right-handed parallel beta-helix repeat-containing protein, partial [Candidatus Pacearchaeota archaeon]
MRRILFVFLFFTTIIIGQPTTQNVYVVRGDTKTLTFSYSGDITETDIQFIVKTGVDFSDPRVIQKTYDPDIEGTEITVTYSAPYTHISVNILGEDTEDLSGYSFYYDITSNTTTIFQGDFKLWYDLSTPYDGTLLPGSGIRISTLALQNGTTTGDLIAWDNDLGRWVPNRIDSIFTSELSNYVEKTSLGYVNVKDFGAVGDSVTDDTDAFQRAFNYIHSIGGGTLIIPEGIYRIDPIVADTGMTNFTMIGYDATLMANDGLGTYSLLQFPLGSHITIKDIEFNGNRDNLTATGHNCLYFANAEYITVENCYIHNFKDLADDPAMGGSGMLLIESDHATIINNTIRGTDVGVYPIGLSDFVISGNKIYEGVSEGIALDVGFWTGKRNYRGVISDNLMQRAITLNCGSDIVISGNTILEKNIAGLLIGLQDAGTFSDSCYAENINVIGNEISSTVYIGYSLSSGNTSNATRFYAEDVSITNNTINPSIAGG